ncbi:hypothetical protein FA15DRAFT_668775 [Coprinopsis marcescibilis]|uniref:CUE domain-containing protein n=1 Tax=Coprinopsis marcescibilis TaxID=230819 RepID=A0A5C3KY52_COPMA|nr:hypothetical protein FA15DRAFT_668775 [Coprinopsis marcescibilis]
MGVQSLPTLPAWPSSSNRRDFTPSQKSTFLSTVSSALSATLIANDAAQNKGTTTGKLSGSTLQFLRSYLLDHAFQNLQATIWGEETGKSPVERAIHAKVLKISEALARQGGLDDVKILTDLAIVYGRTSSSRLRRIFDLAASHTPSLVSDVGASLVPSFTAILQSTQGLYNQRKAAECIYLFIVAGSGTNEGGSPEAPLLRPFIQDSSFFQAISNLYLPGLATTAHSYGGTPALLSTISSSTNNPSDPDPTEWTTIWIKTKLCLIESFHILFKQMLSNLTAAKTANQIATHADAAFAVLFALMDAPHRNTTENDVGGASSDTPLTPFLNLSLLQDYQNSHDLTYTLNHALQKAQERDARLDILEDAMSQDNGLDTTGNKKPGALTIILRGSGLPPRTIPSDAKGKGPVSSVVFTSPPEPPASTSTRYDGEDIDAKTSQILDLLPDTSPQYIGKLLRHSAYSGSTEQVIEALLDGSAIAENILDVESRQREDEPIMKAENYNAPERRNAFDSEVVDYGSVRFGKKKDTAEALLSRPDQDLRERMKADILQRVEIMDMESDEEEDDDPFAVDSEGKKTRPRIVAFEDDDDVDVINVPGAEEEDELEEDGCHSESSEGTKSDGINIESILELAYVADPAVFARDRNTRHSKARMNLSAKTGWQHEQIEGWAIMLERNPKKKERILMKHEFRGNQASIGESQTPSTSQHNSGHGRGGHHRGRGRGGGNGPPHYDGGGGGGDRGGGRGRASKDRHKATRGNHDRKRGHDKKMARAGGPS